MFPIPLLFCITFWYNTLKRNENESPEFIGHSWRPSSIRKGNYIMENIIVDGNTVSLAGLRKGVAEAQKRQYGAERKYAVALNALFTFDWFLVEANDTSENGKAVKAEKTLLYTELKAADHTNPSTVWARIRKYGKEERHGKPEGASGEGGEGEGDGAGKKPRDAVTRNLEELLDLYKFNNRQEGLPSKVADAQKFIAQALMALGVDLSLVK